MLLSDAFFDAFNLLLYAFVRILLECAIKLILHHFLEFFFIGSFRYFLSVIYAIDVPTLLAFFEH